VFVTNNARDFRKLMADAELHAGLIVIAPNVRPIAQSELFERALGEIVQFRICSIRWSRSTPTN